MSITAFADESGTTSGIPCYTIGVLNVPNDYLDEFNNEISEIGKKSGIQGELKWEKIRSSSGQINLCIELLKFILNSPCTYHAIAVEKAPFRKWQEDEESAFFMTYNFLLKQSSHGLNSDIQVIIDQRCTVYKKQDELIKIITNHMLAKVTTSSSNIVHLEMENSKLMFGLQAVDIITGAINSGYHLHFDPNASVKLAKKLAIARMAKILGWNGLQYDTYPNNDFNIWHFPIETRGNPATLGITQDLSVQGITREEYEAMINEI
jgi:hypothetical protein